MTIPGTFSLKCVRRLLRRVLDVLRLGTAIFLHLLALKTAGFFLTSVMPATYDLYDVHHRLFIKRMFKKSVLFEHVI
jgi:hypothetical protein